jgi:hypothetical protein
MELVDFSYEGPSIRNVTIPEFVKVENNFVMAMITNWAIKAVDFARAKSVAIKRDYQAKFAVAKEADTEMVDATTVDINKMIAQQVKAAVAAQIKELQTTSGSVGKKTNQVFFIPLSL